MTTNGRPTRAAVSVFERVFSWFFADFREGKIEMASGDRQKALNRRRQRMSIILTSV